MKCMTKVIVGCLGISWVIGFLKLRYSRGNGILY